MTGCWDWNNNGLFEPGDEWGATVDAIGRDDLVAPGGALPRHFQADAPVRTGNQKGLHAARLVSVSAVQGALSGARADVTRASSERLM